MTAAAAGLSRRSGKNSSSSCEAAGAGSWLDALEALPAGLHGGLTGSFTRSTRHGSGSSPPTSYSSCALRNVTCDAGEGANQPELRLAQHQRTGELGWARRGQA
jgi:hypothetical protein